MQRMHDDTLARATRFRALHERSEPLLLPNPWDAGTARLLAHLGFEALATTSLGVANTIGRRGVGRADVLENLFADDPAEAARTIALASESGASGGSIEDASGDAHKPIYDFAHAVERV